MTRKSATIESVDPSFSLSMIKHAALNKAILAGTGSVPSFTKSIPHLLNFLDYMRINSPLNESS
ncbi:MAG: hypothetical protein K8I03_12825 [Ignavibacteria bacterium]|nr:hypothetical protein [Ignavibacteria bacterium]